MDIKGIDWANIFFKYDHTDGAKVKYTCKQCPAGSQLYTCAKGHGYTNLRTHINLRHSESIPDMVNHYNGIKNGNTLDNYSQMTGVRVSKDGIKYFI